MTLYQCGSCSFRSEELGEAQEHSRRTGHVTVGKDIGEDAAGTADGKFGRARAVAKAGAGVLAATAAGVLAWKFKELQGENDYLKSATGAAKTLKSYDC
ncbi:hypothetical protein ACIA8F_10755 [Streptomyces sp. NPDC051563]|uniref:hypothetical protein n=1 Tax=Streptomyces sp. NPDC051563 TaxID=3365659 RepID=UPI00379AA892